MKFTGNTGEIFEIVELTSNDTRITEKADDTLRLLWFTSDSNVLTIDQVPMTFNENDIVTLTQFHEVQVNTFHTARLLLFNRSFYCILDHDSEVSCKGVLFYGAAKLPVVRAEGDALEILNTVWHMSKLEFRMMDNLQMEMLQMMLKRILILCTRMYKNQHFSSPHPEEQHDLLREFNFLVESHFRTKHSVTDYATLMHKSPKTLAHAFKKMGSPTPLQLIQDRQYVEARRQLAYTTTDISSIAYDLGFLDLQSFSRFFKRQSGQSPTKYRKENASNTESSSKK